jgi:hypothetical protein
MGLLQKIRDLLANRDSASDDEASAAPRDPHEVNIDNVGAGGLYAPIAPPGYVRDDE